MVKFEIAEQKTGIAEGLYANNKNDRGGETYAGIAMKYWPNWRGWPLVHAAVKKAGLTGDALHDRKNWKFVNTEAKKFLELPLLVSDFYRTNFWDVNRLSYLEEQKVANTVYDFGVNCGVGLSARKLQEAYNNIKTSGAAKLVTDGVIGLKTIAAINDIGGRVVFNEFNSLRAIYYNKIAHNDPTQREHLNGWLKRIHNWANG